MPMTPEQRMIVARWVERAGPGWRMWLTCGRVPGESVVPGKQERETEQRSGTPRNIISTGRENEAATHQGRRKP